MKRPVDTVLFLTVGGSSEPIVTSIKHHRPGYVVFVCSDDDPQRQQVGSFPTVADSGKPCVERRPELKELVRLPSIVAQAAAGENPFTLTPKDYRIVKIRGCDSYADCYDAIARAIGAMRRRFPSARLLADYTGGTKSMTAALVAAGSDLGLREFFFVSGRRGNTDRVESGSQRTLPADMSGVFQARRLSRILERFNAGRYAECLALIAEGAADFPTGSPHQPMLQACHDLARSLLAWERFDYAAAADAIEPYRKHFVPHALFLADVRSSLGRLADPAEVGRPPRRRFAPVHDLLLNAARRIEDARHDDAVSRVYRGIEMFVQLALRDRTPPLFTGDLDINRLPEPLRSRYEKRRDAFVDGGARPARLMLGLFEACTLLTELDDPLGHATAPKLPRLRGLLETRNQSFLAHGFTPIGADAARAFLDFARTLVSEGESAAGVPRNQGLQSAPELRAPMPPALLAELAPRRSTKRKGPERKPKQAKRNPGKDEASDASRPRNSRH